MTARRMLGLRLVGAKDAKDAHDGPLCDVFHSFLPCFVPSNYWHSLSVIEAVRPGRYRPRVRSSGEQAAGYHVL